ncbi:MAG: EscU/YscU/HrcU family type III secretion system export apparatus switch protein [Vicinamibacterales bacterium]
MSDSEKNLPPSAKRLKDAREKGNIASSRELSAAFGSLAATAVLVGAGALFAGRMMEQIAGTIRHLGDVPARDIAPADLMPLITTGGALLALTAGPVALAAAGTGVFTSLLQTGFNYSTKTLSLKWDRLSPSNGLSKLAPGKAGIDTLKAIFIATVIGVLAWRAIQGLLTDAAHMTFASPVDSAQRGWADATRLLWQVGFVLLAFGAGDYGLQRWRYMKNLKMSHQEHREEAKQDSNPEIKGRVRRVQREMHRRRMLQSVPTATVIITNPTHFAVALEYNRDKNPAPIVVAKGADRIAAKIREIGRQHSIPIMENPPLARALFKECEIGDTIPGPLFGAVAEILAYLIRIKQLVI